MAGLIFKRERGAGVKQVQKSSLLLLRVFFVIQIGREFILFYDHRVTMVEPPLPLNNSLLCGLGCAKSLGINLWESLNLWE